MKVAKGEGQGTLKIGIIEGIKVLIPADASQNSLTSLNKGRQAYNIHSVCFWFVWPWVGSETIAHPSCFML